MTALFAATAGGASALQRAGSIAAIVGASVAVVLLAASIIGWWWRRHRVWSVKPRIFIGDDDALYLGTRGLPASTAHVIAFVSDGETTTKFGPSAYRRDIAEELLFNLRFVEPFLNESVRKYKVELVSVSDRGEHRRVFKKKLRTTW